MPSPRESETQQEFISRCIPYLIHEGKHPNTSEGRKAAAGECYGLWRNKNKSEKIPVKAGLKDKTGYFCKLENSNNKYYYELETKKEAIKKAEEEWHNIKIEELFKLTETLEKSVPKEVCKGTNIIYKGKKGKIIKIIST